jgi:hypothetical protein
MLPPADRDRLAAAYRRARARWETAPRAAQVRGRLDRTARALAAAAEAVGDLLGDDLALAGLDRAAAGSLLGRLDNASIAAAAAVADLDTRGAGRGGRRRLPAVLGTLPPRAVLLLAVRAALPLASNAAVLAAAAEVLSECGEDDRGLDDVFRRLPQNRANVAEVVPYTEPVHAAILAT